MIVFDIIWNIVWLLYALIGLVLFAFETLLVMAFIAGLGERGAKRKEKNDGKETSQ